MPGSLSPWPVTAAGSNGHPVWTLHDLLRARGHAVAVDGIFGPRTAFQTSKGLTANGTVDPTTWKALIVQVKKGASGDAVRGFQYALSLDIPSVAADGIVGPITWQALVSGMLSG